MNARAKGKLTDKDITPVLLQHGLIDSSFTWIVNEPYESLGYILADVGFVLAFNRSPQLLHRIQSMPDGNTKIGSFPPDAIPPGKRDGAGGKN